MNPLRLRIAMGLEDARLLEIVEDLERMVVFGRRSPGEDETLAVALRRLDEVTQPEWK